MATKKLVPSNYAVSNASYVIVTDPSNMYYNTSHTANYASVRGRGGRSNNSTYYAFINGFDFTEIPEGSTVTAFTVKIRCYRNSNQNTGSSYRLRLASAANNNSVIADTTTSTDIGETVNTITIPTGSLTWATMSNYGESFSIEIPLRNTSTSSSQYPYVYVYGAEIEVTYTEPTYYDVTATTTGGTIDPAGTTQVREGQSYTLTIDVTNPTITDNNINVTSQLVQVTGGSTTLIPESFTSTGFNVTDISNAYTDATSDTSATLTLGGRTTGTLYLILQGLTLPSSATVESVTASATLQFSRGGSSSSFTSSCQMYHETTAKGSATTVVSSATDLAKTTFTLTPGTWTASELSDIRFYLAAYNGASSTQRTMYVYGVSFVVTYSIDGIVYTYTISNVQGNHTIAVTQGSATTLYFKNNGSWVAATAVYKKVNGSWVLQNDLSSVFDANTNYLKGS